jgi:hypothetical protein
MNSKETFERGLAIRKSVLGAEFVENRPTTSTGRCRSW